MIGRIVAQYPRREQRGAPHPFIVTHDARQHAPNGLHRIYLHEREIGRQLSLPSLDDCERMLLPPPERIAPPLKGYTAATKARQKSTQEQRAPGRETLPDDHYGRLAESSLP